MFERIHKQYRWKLDSDPSCAGIEAKACVELPIPLKAWRSLFKRSDGFDGTLGKEAESWGFRYEHQDGQFALGAVYKGDNRPVVFLTDPVLLPDFIEWVKEGLDTFGPGHSMLTI